jgi:hypothetical protein
MQKNENMSHSVRSVNVHMSSIRLLVRVYVYDTHYTHTRDTSKLRHAISEVSSACMHANVHMHADIRVTKKSAPWSDTRTYEDVHVCTHVARDWRGKRTSTWV